ncbi:MAG: hypothetical protein AAGA93_18480 [Actinomycetota bacterium]
MGVVVLSVAAVALVTSIVVTIVVVASWRFRPAVWAADLGLPRQDPVAGLVVLVVLVLLLLAGSVVASMVALDEFGLVGAAIAGWAVMVFFGLWDFLVIDWLIFIGLRPSWFYVEGMENSPQIYDWRHHARESVPAVFIGIPIAAVSTAIAALVT